MSKTPIPKMPVDESDHRKRWTRGQCDLMERLGLLGERYQLIDGEIFEPMGQNNPHVFAVTRLFAWTISVFGVEFVRSQADIEVAPADRQRYRPQPDIAVLNVPDHTLAEIPGGSEVRLVVEVSDSTLRDDLRVKSGVYARAGILEYWVLDVPGRRLYAHREAVDGDYSDVVVVAETDTIASLAAPDRAVLVSSLIPPVAPTTEDV